MTRLNPKSTLTFSQRDPSEGSFWVYQDDFDLSINDFINANAFQSSQIELLKCILECADLADSENTVSFSAISERMSLDNRSFVRRITYLIKRDLFVSHDFQYGNSALNGKRKRLMCVSFADKKTLTARLELARDSKQKKAKKNINLRYSIDNAFKELGFHHRPDSKNTQISTPQSPILNLIEQSVVHVKDNKQFHTTAVRIPTNPKMIDFSGTEPSILNAIHSNHSDRGISQPKSVKAELQIASGFRITNISDLQVLYCLYSLTYEYHMHSSRHFIDQGILPPNKTPIFSNDVIQMRHNSTGQVYRQNFHESITAMTFTTYNLLNIPSLLVDGVSLRSGYTSEQYRIFKQCRTWEDASSNWSPLMKDVNPPLSDNFKTKNTSFYIIEWPDDVFEAIINDKTSFAFPKKCVMVSELLFLLYLRFRIKTKGQRSNYSETFVQLAHSVSQDIRLDNFTESLDNHLSKLNGYNDPNLSSDKKGDILYFKIWGYFGFFDFSEKYLSVQVDDELMLECCGIDPHSLNVAGNKQKAPTRINETSQSYLQVHRQLASKIRKKINIKTSLYSHSFESNGELYEINHYMTKRDKDEIISVLKNGLQLGETTIIQFLNLELSNIQALSIKHRVITIEDFLKIKSALLSFEAKFRRVSNSAFIVKLSRRTSFHGELIDFLSGYKDTLSNEFYESFVSLI